MIRKIVDALDIYGQPIVVNYKGASAYNTIGGALVSLFTIGLGLALAGSKINQMATRTNSTVTQLTNTLDLLSGTESFNLAE
jgi:hypothetical protein